MLQDQSRNRTPMPGAQAPAAAPPDTGPARAEAGIAAMLAEPATSDEASEASLPIEPDLAQACLAQAERLKRWEQNPDSLTEEEGNAEMVRWGIIFRRAVEEPSADLTDLAAKARLMQDDMDRFLPADRYGTDNYRLMRVILREVVALVPSETPVTPPAELPAPGSPEAMAAFSAACRAVDRTMFLDEAERKALMIGNGLQYWTSDVVEAARMGNFSRIMPQDVEAAKATPHARLRELLVLALRRELRIAEAERAWRLCELHALAYPDDQDEVADIAPTGDVVGLAIEAHRAARAALTAACNPADTVWVEQNGGDTSDEAMAPARAIHEAASDAETDAWDTLLEVRPTDPDGLLRMLHYLASAGPMEVLGDAREFGRNIAEAAKAALRPPTVSPALTAMVEEWHLLTGAINAKGNSDEEVERIGARLDAVQTAIYEFPAVSLADLVAKVPVFRDELYDATNGLSEDHEPRETLAGAAWLGLFRDFTRLASGVATPGGGEQAPDPVHALIAEHRAAYAEWDRLSKVWNEMVPDSPGFAEAVEACDAPSEREVAALQALLTARPTTLAGIAALAEYLPDALRQVDPSNEESDGEVALRNIAASLRALGSVGLPDAGLAAALLDRRAKAGEFLDLVRQDGFVPYPADAPRCLMAIDLAISLEAKRLLGIAQTEFDRLADAYVNFPPAEREAHLTRMRAEYRLDELAAAVRGRPAAPAPAAVDPTFATLAEARRLHADWMSTYDAWPHDSIEPPAVSARMNAACRAFTDHLDNAVLKSVPTSLGGCAALGSYVVELLDREEIEADVQGEIALRLITEGLRALPLAPKTEAQTNHSLVNRILDAWRAWGDRPDLDESEAGQAEFDRLSNMRNALIDAAEALPATPENALSKALACAWLDYVQLWSHGQAREDYGSDGRLALDIDTAICGRLKTRYAGVAA